MVNFPSLLNEVLKLLPSTVKNLGLIDYQEAWDYQEELFNEVVNTKLSNRDKPASEQVPTPNYLLFCEHPHVYTLGKSGKKENGQKKSSQA